MKASHNSRIMQLMATNLTPINKTFFQGTVERYSYPLQKIN